MSETETGTETAEAAGPTNAELETRVSGVESKLDLILDKLGGAKDQAHAAAEAHTEERLDRPTSIAEQVRAQLAKERAEAAADADKRGTADRLAAVEAKINMAEQVPEPPQRRIEKILGWR